VTQLGSLGSDSDAMFEVVEISDACFIHFNSLAVCSEFKSGEFGGHSSGEMKFGVFFRNSTVEATYVIITCVVQVMMVQFIIFRLP